MKKTIAISLLLLSSQLIYSQSIQEFGWLEGKWKRQNESPGKSSFEIWTRSNNMLDGLGFTLQNADTVFIEKLQIVEKDGAWNYVANVSHNAASVYFLITSFTKDGFASENPDHDFPKKIEYKLSGDRLTATISGNGKAIPFVFAKEE